MMDGSKSYLVFQAILEYIKTATTTNRQRSLKWKLWELPNEIIQPPTATNNSLPPYTNLSNNFKRWLESSRSYQKTRQTNIYLQDRSKFAYFLGNNITSIWFKYWIFNWHFFCFEVLGWLKQIMQISMGVMVMLLDLM